MPGGYKERDLFIKHFIAKAFRWTPKELDNISAEDLDGIMLIEQEINKKRDNDLEAEQRKSSKGYK